MLAAFLLLLECFSFKINPLGLHITILLWTVTTAGFFLFDNGLLLKWWFYPNWAVWYRQRGPGATPTLLDNTLHRVNLWKSTSITRGFILFIIWSVPILYAQYLLSIIVFIPHTVLNMLGLRFVKAWGGLLRPKLFVLHSAKWRVSDLFHPWGSSNAMYDSGLSHSWREVHSL